MDTTEDTEGRSTVTRRHLLMGATALIAVVAAGGAGYYLWTPPDTAAAQPVAGAEVSMAELMTPVRSATRCKAPRTPRSRSSNTPR